MENLNEEKNLSPARKANVAENLLTCQMIQYKLYILTDSNYVLPPATFSCYKSTFSLDSKYLQHLV